MHSVVLCVPCTIEVLSGGLCSRRGVQSACVEAVWLFPARADGAGDRRGERERYSARLAMYRFTHDANVRKNSSIVLQYDIFSGIGSKVAWLMLSRCLLSEGVPNVSRAQTVGERFSAIVVVAREETGCCSIWCTTAV